MLSKDEILKSKDLPTKKVSVPEWGGDVILKTLTGTERDSYESSMFIGEGKKQKLNLQNVRAKLAVRVIVDDKNKRLFSDVEAAALGGKSASALDRIFSIAQEMNGFSDKDMEDLVKNSGTGQSEDSTFA